MNNQAYQGNLRLLKFQRNIFLVLSLILACSLLISTSFLFWKSDRIVVVPPTIEKEFWVDANSVSSTYLEQFGYFLGELILAKSAQSAQTQRAIVMRHTDPSFSNTLSKKLLEEEQMLAKQTASYVFYPIDVQVNTKTLEVLLLGDRTFYIAGKPISTKREGYVLSFSKQGARILLNGIKAEELK